MADSCGLTPVANYVTIWTQSERDKQRERERQTESARALRVVSVARGRGVCVRQLFEVCPNKRRQLAYAIWFQNKGLWLHIESAVR